MTCEISRTELADVVDRMVETTRAISECTEKYLNIMHEKPLMLVRGEMQTWERLSAEAQFLAARHKELLENFKNEAMGHKDGAPASKI
jgi:hypothetical protein